MSAGRHAGKRLRARRRPRCEHQRSRDDEERHGYRRHRAHSLSRGRWPRCPDCHARGVLRVLDGFPNRENWKEPREKRKEKEKRRDRAGRDHAFDQAWEVVRIDAGRLGRDERGLEGRHNDQVALHPHADVDQYRRGHDRTHRPVAREEQEPDGNEQPEHRPEPERRADGSGARKQFKQSPVGRDAAVPGGEILAQREVRVQER